VEVVWQTIQEQQEMGGQLRHLQELPNLAEVMALREMQEALVQVGVVQDQLQLEEMQLEQLQVQEVLLVVELEGLEGQMQEQVIMELRMVAVALVVEKVVQSQLPKTEEQVHREQ
jgi:hypothetical protein